MTVEVALVISGISVAFAIYFGVSNQRRNKKVDDQNEATAMTTVIVKLENISAGITEIKTELSSVKQDVREQDKRLTIVEQSAKSAHKRLDEIVGDRNARE